MLTRPTLVEVHNMRHVSKNKAADLANWNNFVPHNITDII